MQIISYRVDEGFLHDAILGARLSYGSGAQSDSFIDDEGTLIIGEADKVLLSKLIRAGNGEEKFLRTVPVSAFVRAPMEWWRHFDTYKVGTTKQSDSLMHRVRSRGEFSRSDFDLSEEDWNDDRISAMIDMLNLMVREWIANSGRRNDTSDEWKRWHKMVPDCYLYTCHISVSYAVLRNIYRQRRNHRMSSQWRPFCDWIEELPNSWLITEQPDRRAAQFEQAKQAVRA